MTERQRLHKEKWITEGKGKFKIVLNYCRVFTRYAMGARAQTFKLHNERVSKNYLVINEVCYKYSLTTPIELPPGLEWTSFLKLSDEKFIQVIIKKPEIENKTLAI
jgi:hypothetical protein